MMGLVFLKDSGYIPKFWLYIYHILVKLYVFWLESTYIKKLIYVLFIHYNR